MTHSVSHNLVFELNDNDLIIVILNKENAVLELRHYPIIDYKILTELLLNLPEIYSEITLLIRKKDFIVVPEVFFGNDLEQMFGLSYNLDNEHKLILDKTEYGIGLLYAIDFRLTDLIISKFPRLKIRNESTIIVKKIFHEIGLKLPRILISINNDKLLLFAISDGKLNLCNAYAIKSNDDIFYYVMLSIEQLHFLPGETELVILGEPPHRSEIFELFKNYIKEINIWLEKIELSESIENKDVVFHSFALQNLLCE